MYSAPLPTLESLFGVQSSPPATDCITVDGWVGPLPTLGALFGAGGSQTTVRRWSRIRGQHTITASDLGTRLVIQQRADTVDAAGQVSEQWATWVETWGNVRRVGARDFDAAGQPQASGVVSIVIRWRPGVLPGMRVWCDGQSWDIVGDPVPLAQGLLRFEAQSGVRSAV